MLQFVPLQMISPVTNNTPHVSGSPQQSDKLISSSCAHIHNQPGVVVVPKTQILLQLALHVIPKLQGVLL